MSNKITYIRHNYIDNKTLTQCKHQFNNIKNYNKGKIIVYNSWSMYTRCKTKTQNRIIICQKRNVKF